MDSEIKTACCECECHHIARSFDFRQSNLFRVFHLSIYFSRNSAFEGQSIRCFECNSHTDPRCAEKQVPAYLSVDCSKTGEALKGINHSICRKTTQFVEIPVNGSKYKTMPLPTFEWNADRLQYCLILNSHSEGRGTRDPFVRLD